MKSGKTVFIACLITGVVAACADGSFRSRVSLPLTEVDGQPLPVTVPSGTGTVQVLSGSLTREQLGVECTWVLNFSSGSSPTGTVQDCVISVDDVASYELDLGGPPAPSGVHLYTFGFDLGQ